MKRLIGWPYKKVKKIMHMCNMWQLLDKILINCVMWTGLYVTLSIIFQKPNLILNVDGFIGVAMVDLLRCCGCFTRYVLLTSPYLLYYMWYRPVFSIFLSNFREEAQEYIEIGALNALFVLGRSMGFIGQYQSEIVLPNKYVRYIIACTYLFTYK